MSKDDDFQNTLNYFVSISEKSKPTVKIADNNLKSTDYEAIQKHTQVYSEYLELYVSDYKNKTKKQQVLKIWFFVIVMTLLCLFVAGGIISAVIVCCKREITVPDVITIITATVGSVSSFLVLPKVIAENLFPSSEEDKTAEIFGKMFAYDINIRNVYKVPVSLDSERFDG